MSRKRRVLKILGGFFAIVALLAGGLLWAGRYYMGVNLDRCDEIANLDSLHIPVGLYQGVALCAGEERMAEAIELFALAGMYGQFDAMRVHDRSAHQVIPIMMMSTIGALEPGRKAMFEQAVSESMNDPQRLAVICRKIERIGPPRYYPIYMISHGIFSFTQEKKKTALVEGFNARATWQGLFDSFLHCPQEGRGERR